MTSDIVRQGLPDHKACCRLIDIVGIVEPVYSYTVAFDISPPESFSQRIDTPAVENTLDEMLLLPLLDGKAVRMKRFSTFFNKNGVTCSYMQMTPDCHTLR